MKTDDKSDEMKEFYFFGEKKEPPGAYSRSIYIPSDKVEIFKKAEIIGDKLGINMNVALIQGLQYWVEKNESIYLRRLRDDLLKRYKELMAELLKTPDTPANKDSIDTMKARIARGSDYIAKLANKIARLESTQEANLEKVGKKVIDAVIEHLPDELIDSIWESDLMEAIRDRLLKDMADDQEQLLGDMPPDYNPY